MNQKNLILTAIHEYLQEHGYKTCLYLSAHIGYPPMFCGPPCISIVMLNNPPWGQALAGLRLDNGYIKIYYNKFTASYKYGGSCMMIDPVISVDVNDPNLFGVIEVYCTSPDGND